MKKKKAIVIGAGVGGLAISIRLASLGLEVTVFDANPFAGGKLSKIQLNGYRFDAGPSLFTMPHLVEELYWIAGKRSQAFGYKKLDEVCRYFFPDGTRFSAPADLDELAENFATHLSEKKEVIKKYLADSKFKYETVGKLFTEYCLRKPGTYLGAKAWKSYLNLHRLGLIESLHSANKTRFENPKTVQIFDRYATYNGSDPYQTPAIMSLIPHLEFGIGAFFPDNGMIQITDSLEQLARDCGIEFRFESPVSKILVNKEKGAYGIECQGETIEADVVVSAIDVSKTYQFLLSETLLAKSYKQLPKSTSAIIFYLGMKKEFPELGLHNLFFSGDYAAEFEALFKTKTMTEDPTIYVNISSKQLATDAPEGSENWFVMVNAPANEGQDWDHLVAKTRQIVLDRLSRELNTELTQLIENETHLDPRTLETRTGGVAGALYGSNSNGRFAAFLRHSNFSNQIPHLYFCGGTVHPGGGIPLALQSAAIAATYIKEREL